MNLELIEKVKQHCKNIITNSRCDGLPFHNWQHTLEVVRDAICISEHEGFTDDEIEILIIAAYFHDTGQAKYAEGHEHLSSYYAQKFLESKAYNSVYILIILNAIKATLMPQRPNNKFDEVLCDADLAHVGKTNFLLKNGKLRREWALFNRGHFTDAEWLQMDLKFLHQHHFHTNFAKQQFQVQKEKNSIALKQMLRLTAL